VIATLKEKTMKHTRSLTILITLVSLVSLALVSTAVAAGPDPKATPLPGQGTLEIQNLDHEITVTYRGTGYTLHRHGVLRLAVDAGQNDFDYFCGGHKYFVGDVKVAARGTTTVTLQADGCADTVVNAPAPAPPTALELQQAYNDGFSNGFFCQTRETNYSSNPLIQAEYDRGYTAGFTYCN
jgi:hypothetical protein